MEVCSSIEMGAPGASHLGTGDHGPKTDRSRPRSVPVNAHPAGNRPPTGDVGIPDAVRLPITNLKSRPLPVCRGPAQNFTSRFPEAVFRAFLVLLCGSSGE